MTRYSTTGRIAAGVAAATAWVGLGLYLATEIAGQKGNVLGALWVNASFLTDLTNLCLAVVMSGVALGVARLSKPVVVGWVVTAILTVGIGFWLIGGRLVLGKSDLSDILLHGATPLLAFVFWAGFAVRGVTWKNVLVWMFWPAIYWSYALVRGGLTGEYAYGFLDWPRHGVWSVGITLSALIGLYAACGLVVVWIDKTLGPKRQSPARARET
ncbi:Pr6Pr family membrane protein [Brevundimonas goettingensis]|uniref:Pr6Pr family membrane protein n=1 Tax=Brevundimonas goettingensis TaxID=2774190 RepID=A0A975GUQ0_9CAUL|nr:Pr6Pr family membrane protein [Brevundimonas goettingensis]QTC89649.1 Pr6Pr family membrane protein [Brevundimonas goettingensis]